jgi:hypothetical protein
VGEQELSAVYGNRKSEIWDYSKMGDARGKGSEN